jgi:hypothetical protein
VLLPVVNFVLAAILDLVQVSMTDYVQVYSMIRPRLGS